MSQPRVGFATYGVHKDGLQDPLGAPFVDAALTARARQTLRQAGLALVEHETVIASKQEARECLARFKRMDDVDAVVLFSGTWVWAAHLVGAIQDFSRSGKGLVLWTHPGSQGWRPVGGLVLHGALEEVGIAHRFVYGALDRSPDVGRIVSYCRASQLKNSLNLSTVGAFGGRGMGQTCGVADPSQWMRVFGVDIDSRDTTGLIRRAKGYCDADVRAIRERVAPLFAEPVPESEEADRSLRLYHAIRDTVAEEDWAFYTIQSFPGLGDDYCATCFAQSMMLEDGVGTSTLSDFNTALTVKLLTDLSSQRVYYGDLQHVDTARREIKIVGDGACPPSLAGRVGPARFATHGIPTEGEAGGLAVDLVCKAGRGVLARLSRCQGRFEMVVVRCSVFEPPAEQVEERRRECGIPFWPHAFVEVDGDVEGLLETWCNEYAVLGYDEHLYEDLLDFCDLTGIEAIALSV